MGERFGECRKPRDLRPCTLEEAADFDKQIKHRFFNYPCVGLVKMNNVYYVLT